MDHICPNGDIILDFIEYRINGDSDSSHELLPGWINNRKKFSTLEEWRGFGKTIKARLAELCGERKDNICNALEESL